MIKFISALFILVIHCRVISQDTFSIVAVDSITGEVGSAGASCVDLFQTSFEDDDFLGVLFPGEGAINSQAAYLPSNQNNATSRFLAGDTPAEIIGWLVDNDIQDNPQIRQYGVVRMVNGSPQSAGFTGSSCIDYKNHITGPNYSIQGNILSGQAILDSMEARFLSASGDLACRLMAALQGANSIGADSRCAANGTSSLFAFVKVAQPDDEMDQPAFRISVRTHNGDGTEPIDSLQVIFDQTHNCTVSSEIKVSDRTTVVYPNPTSELLTITNAGAGTPISILLINSMGQIEHRASVIDRKTISMIDLSPGIYYVLASDKKSQEIFKVVKL